MHLARDGGARHPVDQQRDQDRREGQLHVGDPHDERIDAPARVTRDQPQHDADQHGQHHRRQPDQERHAGAVQDGRIQVPALAVGAQQLGLLAVGLPGGGQQGVQQFHRGQVKGVVRRAPAGPEGADQQQRQQHGRHDGHGRPAPGPGKVAVPPAFEYGAHQ
ncbi:hypothetical protein G6F57_019058 [Rhizopus arrhizus]|nr:hypothetical protein G6F57_019058 [Rhizopus arrhizus]